MNQDLLLLIGRIVLPALAFWAGLAVGRRTAPKPPALTTRQLAEALAARHDGCHDHVLVDEGKLVAVHDSSGGCGEAMQALIKHRIGEALKAGVPLEAALRNTLGQGVVMVSSADMEPPTRPDPHSVN